jgi:nucleoporin NUP82
MNADDDWSKILNGHPIFSLPKSFTGPTAQAETSLELSSNTLPKFTRLDPADDGPTPSGRRQVMVLKDADLIVAAGREIRMSSIGDTKLSNSLRQTFKVLVLGNITMVSDTVYRPFIHQISNSKSTKSR